MLIALCLMCETFLTNSCFPPPPLPPPPAVDLRGAFGVDIVGAIPPGLPSPTFPRLDKLTTLQQVEDMAGVALVASIVSFIITHSIAKSLAGATEVGKK